MASSRRPSSRGRTGGRRPASRAARSSDNNQQAIVIASVAGVLVVVAAVWFMSQGDKTAKANANDKPAARSSDAGRTGGGEPAPVQRTERGGGRPGKTPDRPAPSIPDSFFTEADGLLTKAKDAWNAAQKVRGERAQFKQHLDTSWRYLQDIRKLMAPYSEWHEEASMEDWAMPGQYTAFEKFFERWNKVYKNVHKVKG